MRLHLVPLARLFFVATVALGCADRGAALVPPTAERDPRLPQVSIEVAGFRRALHLETFGDEANPVLLVYHGGEGSDFRGLLPLQELSERCFVVMWDARGSGLSERRAMSSHHCKSGALVVATLLLGSRAGSAAEAASRLNVAGAGVGVESTPVASVYYARLGGGLFRPSAETRLRFTSALLTGLGGGRLRLERDEVCLRSKHHALQAAVLPRPSA